MRRLMIMLFVLLLIQMNYSVYAQDEIDLENLILRGNWKEILKIPSEDNKERFAVFLSCYLTDECEQVDEYAKYVFKMSTEYNKEVASFCDHLVKSYHNNSNAHLMLGIYYRFNNQSNKSIKAYEKSIKLAPNNFAPYFMIAEAYGGKGNIEKHLFYIEKSIQFNPDFASAFLSKGKVLREMKNYPEAKKSYEQALRLFTQKGITKGSNLRKVCFDLGYMYLNQKKPDNDRAIEFFSKAVEVDPDWSEKAWNELGIAYKRKGLYNKAIASYAEGLKLNPNHPQLWFNLGVAYYRSNMGNKAKQAFEKVLEVDPQGSLSGNAKQWLTLF